MCMLLVGGYVLGFEQTRGLVLERRCNTYEEKPGGWV